MPILGLLLDSGFVAILAWLGTWFTRKVAFGIASMILFSSLTLALYVAMRAVLLTLNSQTVGMPDFWVVCLSIAVPPVASACFASYMTIWTACTVYVWQRDLLRIAIQS